MHSARLLRRCSGFALRVTSSPGTQVKTFAPPFSNISPIEKPLAKSISTKSSGGGFLRQKELTSVPHEKVSANTQRIREVIPRNSDWMIEVTFEDGYVSRYPYIWLKDNCQCPNCFHTSSLSRRVLLEDLDVNITPLSIRVISDGRDIEIDWSDGHIGYFPANWLHDRSFSEENRKKNKDLRRPSHLSWGSELQQQLPEADFSKVIENDEALLGFLLNLEKLGLVIMKNVPRRAGEIQKLTELIGFLKRTHYGSSFSVKMKADPNNLAYTTEGLNLHTDLPYLESRPGVQLLHCISQASEGGSNDLVDSYHVALKLRESHPEKFNILSSVPVNFIDIGEEDHGYHFDARYQWPVIQLDRDGDITGVAINQMVRDSSFDIPVDQVRDWYDAMITFYDLLYHPDNLIKYKMAAGEMVVFDNLRVMHGRTGYRITEGTRELEGAYWDWDMARSCRRVLQTKLGYPQDVSIRK